MEIKNRYVVSVEGGSNKDVDVIQPCPNCEERFRLRTEVKVIYDVAKAAKKEV